MSTNGDAIIPTLPKNLRGDGIANVNITVPHSEGSFSPAESNQPDSYSYPLMSPAKLIGSLTAPFMNVGISSYISTLYQNVYNINKNLQNNIQAAQVDDRQYPTSFAVQTYVQSQISGTQILNNASGNSFIVNTTVNNTFIQSVPNASLGYEYVDSDNQIQSIALLYMDTDANAPRNGTSKTVMLGDTNYLTNGGVVTGDLIYLYAGDDSVFAYMGSYHKYYQFVYAGDFVSFIQAYNGTSWVWLVTNCMGVFSNSVSVTGANINSTTPAKMPLPGSNTVPLPASSSMGGLPF
jgi:hypothetical protein